MSLFKTGDITLTAYNPLVVQSITALASKRAANQAVKYIRQELARSGRMDTGELAGSFAVRAVPNALGPAFEVYSTLPPTEPSGRTVADIVNNGTGIYGPYGTPIVSPYGKVMRFNPSKRASAVGRRGVRNSSTTGRFESAYVYAISVKGQEGVQFIEKATARIKLVDFAI